MTCKQFLWGSVLSLLSISVFANDYDESEQGAFGNDDDYQFSVGAMIGRDPSIYVGGKDQTQAFPFFTARWGNFFFQGPSLGYMLHETENWQLSTTLDLDGLGNNNRDDSPVLADMGDFDSVFLASVKLDYGTEWGQLGFSLGRDISGAHDGYKVNVSYSYAVPLGGWMIEPQLSVEWVSEEINQYFYGVTEAQVIEGRAAYKADAGINYDIGVSAMYPIMQNHAIMLRLGHNRVSSEVSDSPIVGSKGSTSFGVGYIYRF